MGIVCGCNSFKNSEIYLRNLLESNCLKQMTMRNFNNLLVYHIKGAGNYSSKPHVELTIDLYQLIIKDIIEEKFILQKSNMARSNSIEIIVLRKLFEKLFEFIDCSTNMNYFLFKMIMFPLLLKEEEKDNDEKKMEYLYNLLLNIDLKNSEIDNTSSTIPFNQFCDSLLFYITSVISGISKKLYESLTELEIEPMIRSDLFEIMQEYFQIAMFNNYFKHLMGKFMKQLLLTRKEEKLDDYNVTYDDFKSIVKDSPQIIHYYKLRDDYLVFTRKSRNQFS